MPVEGGVVDPAQHLIRAVAGKTSRNLRDHALVVNLAMTNVRRRICQFAFALFGLVATTLTRAASDDVRFSASLTPEQRTSAGLTALSSDNVAIIDGLVRQDEAASKLKNNVVDHTRFSQRRTARELEISGLNLLGAAQLDALDNFVGTRIGGTEASYISSTDSSSGTAGAVESVKLNRPLEIHGEISYTYGRSKAGSFQGGDLVLTYDDPAHRFSVLVGYSEYHGKGLPYCFYPSPPLSDGFLRR